MILDHGTRHNMLIANHSVVSQNLALKKTSVDYGNAVHIH